MFFYDRNYSATKATKSHHLDFVAWRIGAEIMDGRDGSLCLKIATHMSVKFLLSTIDRRLLTDSVIPKQCCWPLYVYSVTPVPDLILFRVYYVHILNAMANKM